MNIGRVSVMRSLTWRSKMVHHTKPEPRNWPVTVICWGGLTLLIALSFMHNVA